MDLSNPPDDSKIALLTIPRSDLQTESSLASPAPSKPMILLQLPPRWSVSDLQSAHFVASTPSQHLACVVESKHCSFTVHNVETSNTLVMLPHPKSLQREAIHETKRCKVTELGKTLTVLPAHLLTKGGSGASFLELRVKTLNYVDLLSALDGCVLNPYSTASGEADDPDSQMSSTSDLSTSPMTTNSSATIETVGRSILDLAASLQCSKHEIEKGLRMIQAYALPRTDPSQYCLISDEAFQECNSTIVSTLAEAEGCDDYAGTGITINDFVKEAMERMNENDRFDDVDSVIRHCLQLLRIKSHTSSSNCYRDTQIIQLDVSKVAAIVARGLFQRQAAPLDEEALFSRWQSDLPGVGETYKVTHAMLLGLAVRLESNEGTVWHYLPREKLPTNPSACFEVLFDVKDKWSRLELDPYLDHMSKAATSLTQSELLLHYSKDIVEEQDGIELKYFNKK